MCVCMCVCGGGPIAVPSAVHGKCFCLRGEKKVTIGATLDIARMDTVKVDAARID